MWSRVSSIYERIQPSIIPGGARLVTTLHRFAVGQLLVSYMAVFIFERTEVDYPSVTAYQPLVWYFMSR